LSDTSPSGKPRARALGIQFPGQTGAFNAITDVPGVEVGYVTKIEGQNIRTGVTAILPRGKVDVGVACAAAFYSLNGNGEMTGTIWIEESGSLAMPILITNTHAVGQVHSGVIEWVAENKPAVAAQWLLPVVAETWDGYLNEINNIVISKEDAKNAINSAESGSIDEGSVGGGTGMNCYQYKGGSGTSSRTVKYADKQYAVGAFVQANFGDRDELTIRGVSMQNTVIPNPIADTDWFEKDKQRSTPPGGAGSVIVVIATDAPLLPLQCKALAKRVPMGLARTGTTGSHFSGDIFLAFSTANKGSFASEFPIGEPTEADYDTSHSIPWGRMDPFYTAVVQAVEEAVINALVVNEDIAGREGHKSFALTHELIQSKFPRD
jgi:L-aminopeptidase/D-esterase-like protein